MVIHCKVLMAEKYSTSIAMPCSFTKKENSQVKVSRYFELYYQNHSYVSIFYTMKLSEMIPPLGWNRLYSSVLCYKLTAHAFGNNINYLNKLYKTHSFFRNWHFSLSLLNVIFKNGLVWRFSICSLMLMLCMSIIVMWKWSNLGRV